MQINIIYETNHDNKFILDIQWSMPTEVFVDGESKSSPYKDDSSLIQGYITDIVIYLSFDVNSGVPNAEVLSIHPNLKYEVVTQQLCYL